MESIEPFFLFWIFTLLLLTLPETQHFQTKKLSCGTPAI
jgi:hypothetical protein